MSIPNSIRLLGCLTFSLAIGVTGCGKDGGDGGEEATAKPVGDEEAIAKGRELFRRHGCGACHGEEGREV